MFKGIGNIASMLKQAQQLGGRLQGVNEELKTKRAVGTSGGGMVEVEVNGLGQVLRVTIDPQLVEKKDRELIEGLLPAAINQAQDKAKQLHMEAMKSLTSGMEMPGLDDAISQITGGGNSSQ